ncbi:ABC transporter substrate-binding protein [Paenibacillus daejeonensis]|uniref:ABC transporter substrate-binding protein n=1 Tax=Paenibacillus daejeonensis TaxID=135193 RepID=UPI00035D0A0D
MKKKAGLILAMSLILLTTAACGTNEGKPAEESADNQAAASSNEQAEQPEPAAESKEDVRILQDEFGEVQVPAHPERIVALYLEDYLSMLGVEPVVQWYHPNWGQQDYLDLDVPLFDATSTPEAWLELAPDLIIADGAIDADTYATLSKIAPTYRLPEAILLEPEAILTQIADVLGIPEKASAAISDYKRTMEETSEQLQQAVGEETVAVVRLNVGDKTLALFGMNNRYTGNIYHEMGLTPHPWARDMEGFQEVLSDEAIADLDADHIILFPSDGSWEDETNKDAVQWLDQPLWQSLPAVQNEHVYIMGRTHWQSGGMTANLLKAEDLLRVMTE